MEGEMAILCATNFSEAARDASTAAALLARRTNEPLVLLHLLPAGLSQALGTRLYEAARETLEQEQGRLAKLGVRVTGRMAEGSLLKELPAAADEVPASLVVVGDPAEGGAAGGTVDRLARLIAVPLLIVKSTHAFGEWARAERSLRVVVGADRGAASDAALAFAARLSTFGPVERCWWSGPSATEDERRRRGLVPHPRSLCRPTSNRSGGAPLWQRTLGLLVPLPPPTNSARSRPPGRNRRGRCFSRERRSSSPAC
jgi:nucleotide-binding universal stress UspA family protein